MKTSILFLVCASLLATPLSQGISQEMPAGSKSSLPQNIQDFIKSSPLLNKTITTVTVDDDEYEVRLADNTYIDFESDGDWEEIINQNGLPATLLPQEIQTFLATYFSGVEIIKIEKDSQRWKNPKYEIVLANKIEIEFDSDYQWESIETKSKTPLPVNFIPQEIKNCFNSDKLKQIKSIEKRRRGGYEVELFNELEYLIGPDGKLKKFDLD